MSTPPVPDRMPSQVPAAAEPEASVSAPAPAAAIPAAPASAPAFDAKQYFLEDYRHTLFPLSSTQLLVEKFSPELKAYALANPFRPQTRCSAAKRGYHLRRTFKLDPPTEFFVYEMVYRNRNLFRKDFNAARSNFGFLFRNGVPVSSRNAYQDYQTAVLEAKKKYKYGIRFDVASYFNSVYHHDLVSRFREIGGAEDEVALYGRFLREINSGRSLDCLPQGLHPCKLIGADFLKFIDNSMRLKSPRFIRFLDDFNIFADREQDLLSDMNTIQEMLSDKGLFLNEGKTKRANDFGRSMTEEIDEIKKQLLQARGETVDPSSIEMADLFEFEDDDEDEEEEEEEEAAASTAAENAESRADELNFFDSMTDEQTEYLLDLLNNPEIDESDAELALVLLKDHGEDVLEHMGQFLVRFPGLSRTIYQFSPHVQDKAELCNLVLDFLRGDHFTTEYQLFWITKMLEDHLADQPCYGTSLALLNQHPSSTPITRAKLLEIPEHRFGMPELREQALRSGQCDWPAWAAAIGCRKEDAARRNHLLGYFENGGPMNRLVGTCAKSM